MDKLASYGSDDDYEDSPKYKKTEERSRYRGGQEEADVNYDEVQMEMSEDSDSSSDSSKDKNVKKPIEKVSRRSPSPRARESKSSRDGRDRRGDRRRDRSSREDRYKDSRHSRDKYERSRRRSSSRERERERRSRSPPRRSDYRSKRSGSRERRKFNDLPRKPNVVQEKPQETQKLEPVQVEKKSESDKDRFFMPGITGRFRDQIERRKLLWQKKEETKQTPTTSTSTKVWQTTTFAQDTDGKVASKFKRLMGIKDQADQAKQPTDVLQRQEEMFSSMEQQYEVARTATHTMRGVGLGFGSYQR